MSDTMDSTNVDFGAIAAAAIDKINSADTAATLPPEIPPPAADPAPVPAAESTAAAGAEVDAFDDDKVQAFDRDYVSKLRDKEARYRTERNEIQERWAEWDSTLEGLDDDQRGLARELVASILQGDLARAAEIIGRDELAEVLGAVGQAAPAATQEAAPTEAPLTRADLEREFAAREAQRKAEQDIDAVFNAARDLGYNPDAKPGSPEYGRWVMVVQYAQANGGSLDAGHKALEAAEAAERQRIIDEFVASRNPGSPAPATGSGAAAREPADGWLDNGNPLEAAKRRALERVSADRTQLGG